MNEGTKSRRTPAIELIVPLRVNVWRMRVACHYTILHATKSSLG